MNMGYINTMASNLAVCFKIEHKAKISAAAFRDKIPEICQLALRGQTDSSPKVKEAAITLLDLLKAEGVDVQASAKLATAEDPLAPGSGGATAEAEPNSAAGKITHDWTSFERLATEEAGPMGSRIVVKIRNESAGQTPRQAIAKIKATLGSEITQAIFTRYKGN